MKGQQNTMGNKIDDFYRKLDKTELKRVRTQKQNKYNSLKKECQSLKDKEERLKKAIKKLEYQRNYFAAIERKDDKTINKAYQWKGTRYSKQFIIIGDKLLKENQDYLWNIKDLLDKMKKEKDDSHDKYVVKNKELRKLSQEIDGLTYIINNYSE